MKRLVVMMIVLALVGTAFAVCCACAVHAEATVLPHTDAPADKTADDRNYYGFVGRFLVPDVGIDVALYSSYDQAVCDRWDSACYFPVYPYPGKVIADHCNQEFSTLTSVSVGTFGQITLEDGSIISIRCAEVFDGHNTSEYITDANWNVVLGKYDYLTYTCMNGWQNIRVCQWEIVQ